MNTLNTRTLRAVGAAAAVAAALLLTACANPAREQPGAAQADVLQRLGQPSSRHPLPSGERLLYSGQPSGWLVYNLDFDTAGRLQRVEQVLTIEKLSGIPVGSWTQADVRRTLGLPALVERVARFDGEVWTYRFKENNLPRLAHVHIDRAGIVRQVLFTDETPNFDDGGRQ